VQCARQNPTLRNKVAHMAKVAFLGLGVMGFPMAGHLAKKGGHDVTVYNRTAAKAKQWADKFGGRTAPTPKAAAEGQDLAMCCVKEDGYARAEPVIAAYARMCKRLGPAGAGQLTKMVNQICIAGLVQGLSEGIHFAKKSGLDVHTVIDTISKGAAQSWQMENRYKTMNEGKFDFGFAVEWMRKDLSICIAESRRNGANLPVTALVDQFYSEVEKMGGKRWDTSSLMARLER